MATIRQAINETIERGISNKCAPFFMHANNIDNSFSPLNSINTKVLLI